MTKIPNLFNLMKEKNITIQKLSNETGISQGNISDWKSGKSCPTVPALLKLSKYLHISIDYLLDNKDYHENKK